jgi:hypothetical protein
MTGGGAQAVLQRQTPSEPQFAARSAHAPPQYSALQSLRHSCPASEGLAHILAHLSEVFGVGECLASLPICVFLWSLLKHPRAPDLRLFMEALEAPTCT